MDSNIVEEIMNLFLDYDFIDDNEYNSTLRKKLYGYTKELEEELKEILLKYKDTQK